MEHNDKYKEFNVLYTRENKFRNNSAYWGLSIVHLGLWAGTVFPPILKLISDMTRMPSLTAVQEHEDTAWGDIISYGSIT